MFLVFGEVPCRENNTHSQCLWASVVHTRMLGGPVILNSFFGGCAWASAVTVFSRSGFLFHRTCSGWCQKRQTWKKGKRLFRILKKVLGIFPALAVLLGRSEKLWACRWFKGHWRCPLGKNLSIYLLILSKIGTLALERKKKST